MRCHICNKRAISFTHKKTDICYYYCKNCEYIFKSPEYYQDFKAQKERYNLHKNDADDAGYRAYFQRFLDFVMPHIHKPKNALDFGCGCTSLLATLLEEEGIACDYYDPIYYPDSPEENKSYDLIVSTEVFEHLHQPKEVFEDLIGRLNRGGYLALQTEFHPKDKEKFLAWWYHQDPTHIVFFAEQTFVKLSDLYDCKIIKCNHKNRIVLQKI